jgi:hypothetical protein
MARIDWVQLIGIATLVLSAGTLRRVIFHLAGGKTTVGVAGGAACKIAVSGFAGVALKWLSE